MPPKKKGKGKGKSSKPAWMSEELFALSQDLPKLIENFRGPSSQNTGDCTISKEQMLWPNDKKAKAKREEAVKGELIEVSVKNLALVDEPAAVPAAGLLALLCQGTAEREALLAARPAAIPSLLRAVSSKTVSLVSAACALLRAMSAAPETRTKLLMALRDWDWQPLLTACSMLRAMGSLGGRSANMECTQALAALTGPPFRDEEGGLPNDKALAEAAQLCLYKAGGLKTMIEVAGSRGPPLSAGSACVTVLNMFKSLAGSLRHEFLQHGGVMAMIRVMQLNGAILSTVASALQNPYVQLPHRASAAGCLWSYMAPDQRVGSEETDAAVLKRTADRIDAKAKAPPKAAPAAIAAVSDIEGENGLDALRLEQAMLDPAERDRVLERCRIVAAAGAIPLLMQLCVGPEGLSPDITEDDATEAAGAGGKKKKAKKKSKKKAKLEPGMEEAQTYGAGCLRLLSLDDAHKDEIMRAGAARCLPQLLESKQHQARWHARQALLNLSMVPDNAAKMKLYGLPNFITGGNIPAAHFLRPLTPASKPADGLAGIIPT